MAITLTAASAKILCDALVDRCDEGSPPGSLEVGTAAMEAVLVTFTLGNPAFGAATSATPSVATANAIASALATGDGTAAAFRVKNAAGTELWSGTAGMVGTDLILDNSSIATGQTVSITSWTHSQPAS